MGCHKCHHSTKKCKCNKTSPRDCPKACKPSGVIKYIQAGALAGGSGSKSSPFNALAQAEAAVWDTLIVLSSSAILYGGIALKDGQKLIGENRASSILASVDASVHNGDVIVANGDNCVSNITIAEAFRCGLSALNAQNLSVYNSSFNHTNTSAEIYKYDYDPFDPNVATFETAFWSAISFFGGPTTTASPQPFNTTSGLFELFDSSFDSNLSHVWVGSGDNVATGFVSATYYRKYKVSRSQFTNLLENFDAFQVGLVAYASGGGDLSGSVTECLFDNIPNAEGAVVILSIQQNLSGVFPGRGNYNFGTNTVQCCSFSNITYFTVIVYVAGNLTGTNAKLVWKKNTCYNVGATGSGGPPAVIEFGYAPFQMNIRASCSGNAVEWIVSENHVVDPTGLAPAISAYFDGGSTKLNAKIEHNTIVGTTTGVNILNLPFGATPPSTGQISRGDFLVRKNKFNNNDCVIVVSTAPDAPYTDLKVKVQENCFQNTGARNSPPLQDPDFNDPGAYYGAAVIFGGANNTALQSIGQEGSNLGNATLDLGGGPLGSTGHNSFLDTTGADSWVEAGLTLYDKINWFGGDAPVDAGVGGIALFNPVLATGPSTCNIQACVAIPSVVTLANATSGAAVTVADAPTTPLSLAERAHAIIKKKHNRT